MLRAKIMGGYPMYLVTQGRQVGIWHNWTVAKTMVEGYPQSTFRGHHTVEGCTREWQIHCGLGVHPHPVDPSLQSPLRNTNASRARARPVDPELQALFQQAGTLHARSTGTAMLVGCDGDSLSTASTGSSITVTTWWKYLPRRATWRYGREGWFILTAHASPPPRDPTPPLRDPTPPAPPTIVKSGKGKIKPRRHKKGEEKQAPGKESWVHGTKLVFFERRKAEYLQVAEMTASGDKGTMSLFYTKMTRLYLLKYGYNLADDEDLAVDVEDPADERRIWWPEEIKLIAHQRIGEWYRRKYSSLLKSDKAAFQELFTGVLTVPPEAQHRQLLHFYSPKCFETRHQRRAVYTGEKVPAALALQNTVTKEVWDDETPAFQQEMKLNWEQEYQAAVKGWKASLSDSPTRTAEELATSLENAAYYLQPFVDAIQERFKMSVALLLCGPIGKRGGVIGMQSVHAGETKGLAPLSWPQWDRMGFQEVETKMVEFAKECYWSNSESASAGGSSGEHDGQRWRETVLKGEVRMNAGIGGGGGAADEGANGDSGGNGGGGGGEGAADNSASGDGGGSAADKGGVGMAGT
ncbi:hypothetical protein B0H13DRAFT_1884165, partial [Mycena leptocephala]